MKYWPEPPRFKPTRDNYSEIDNRPLEGLGCVIVGGGPGLKAHHIAELQSVRCIAVNNSYALFRHPVPVLSLDRRWWEWHGANVSAIGHLALTAIRPNIRVGNVPGIVYLHRAEPGVDLSVDRGTLAGKNSGHAALNLAVHLGASRVYLAGFDMDFPQGESHWHPGHVIPAQEPNYTDRFRPRLENAVRTLTAQGISVSAITRTSAAIPCTDFDTALKDLQCAG